MMEDQSRIVLCGQCRNEYIDPVQYPPVPIDVLHSTHVPSESEVHQAAMLLAEEEEQLKRCTEELRRLHDIVERLESQKSVLEQRVAERRSVTSVIRRVPMDIWNLIYSNICIGNSTYALSTLTNYKGRFEGAHARPLRLSQVSAHWRQIVKSLPRLWSSISIDIYGIDQRIVDLLELFVENSGGQPLRLKISDSQDPDYVDDDSTSEDEYVGAGTAEAGMAALQRLMAEMYRCEELRLNLGTWKALRQLSKPVDFAFPKLRKLAINTSMATVDPFRRSSRWLWEAVHAASSLVDVSVRSEDDLDMNVPVQQLTTLLIGNIHGIHALLHLLPDCASLESLTIQRFRPSRGGDTVPSTKVQSTFLRVLSIHGDHFLHPNDSDTLVASLDLPNLTTLQFGFLPDHFAHFRIVSDWPSQTFIESLERLSPTLSKLSLHLSAAYVSDTSMSKILAAVPSLTHLVVGLEGDTSPDISSIAILEKLTVSASDTVVLVPKLQKFSLTHSKLESPVDMEKVEGFLKMTESRSCGTKDISVLMTSRVAFLGRNDNGAPRRGEVLGLNPEVLQRLEALKKAGVECIIGGNSQIYTKTV
ncbi:hypothetical protein WG66_007720 [Moniliophthora roreri]|nr:hypothetical protein WG66_007720 [Moniliophthora roreri]